VPFVYKVPIPTELAASRTMFLREWLLNPGDYVDFGYGLALVHTDHGIFELCANGKGLLHRCNAAEGAEILDRENVCTIASEGEDIPYDRPYSTCRQIE